MKTQSRMFLAYIEAHDNKGVKYQVPIITLGNKDSIENLLKRVGISIKNLYSLSPKGRAFPLAPCDISELEDLYGIRLGEFKYEPVIFVCRKYF
jgi:hypothetical protein